MTGSSWFGTFASWLMDSFDNSEDYGSGDPCPHPDTTFSAHEENLFSRLSFPRFQQIDPSVHLSTAHRFYLWVMNSFVVQLLPGQTILLLQILILLLNSFTNKESRDFLVSFAAQVFAELSDHLGDPENCYSVPNHFLKQFARHKQTISALLGVPLDSINALYLSQLHSSFISPPPTSGNSAFVAAAPVVGNVSETSVLDEPQTLHEGFFLTPSVISEASLPLAITELSISLPPPVVTSKGELLCFGCGLYLLKSDFSAVQFKKGAKARRCKICVGGPR